MNGSTLLLVLAIVWLVVTLWVWWREDQRARQHDLSTDLLAAGLLLVLTLSFFWRTLSGDVYQPADGGDLVSFLFPTYRFAAQQLQQGILPLWNPTLYGGAPFISDIQAGFLYLPNLLLFLLKPDFDYTALQWLAIAHLYWAGLGMYVLLSSLTWDKEQQLSRPAALFGALAFQFSDPLLIHLGNLNLIAVLSWLPWVLAAYQRGLVTRSLRWIGVAALCFALGNYAGHAQSSLYIGLALGLYTLIWLYQGSRYWRLGIAGVWRITDVIQYLVANLSYPITLFTLTALLTAPILLPALELTRYTERSHFAYQETVNFSLAPTQAIGLITPGFFGHGPALHWSLWERVETPYLGVATLLLGLAGFGLASQATRRKLVPWLVIALFGFVTALGIYAILHGWLTWLVPGFGQLRAPARALILWAIGWAVLAAVGFDQLCGWAQHTRYEIENTKHGTSSVASTALNSVLKVGAIGLVGFFAPLLYCVLLLTQQDQTAFVRASVAALAVTLAGGYWLATWGLIRLRWAGWISAGLFAGLMLALLFFDLSATSAYTDISPTAPTQGFVHPEIVDFLRGDPDLFRIDTRTDIEALWQPDAAALFGLQDVDGVANPLSLSHWQAFWEATGGRQTERYDQLNVKYVIVRKGTPLPEGKFELAFDAPGELAVYRNRAFLRRVWLADSQASVDRLTPLAAGPAATVTQYTANQLTVQVQTTSPAYLVLSEVWYPGWQATVNGNSTPVLRANQALRALAVPTGSSTVHLWFAPRSWYWGVGIGLLGLLLLAWVLFSERGKRSPELSIQWRS